MILVTLLNSTNSTMCDSSLVAFNLRLNAKQTDKFLEKSISRSLYLWRCWIHATIMFSSNVGVRLIESTGTQHVTASPTICTVCSLTCISDYIQPLLNISKRWNKTILITWNRTKWDETCSCLKENIVCVHPPVPNKYFTFYKMTLYYLLHCHRKSLNVNNQCREL